MSWSASLLWLSIAGLAYIYAGYPLLVGLLGKLRRRTVTREPWVGTLSVVIAGYNEAKRLTAKLDSVFASTIADRIVEVLIGSDGSDDDTREVLARYGDPRVRLVHFDMRRGKPAVLNDLVPQCQGETVILTDARQQLDSEGVARLCARFSDPTVGVVSGELMFRCSADDTAAAKGMGAYWTYEELIRKSEASFRSVPGATGAFYAIRRQLFRAVPENTLLDDVVIPMQAVEQGYRCVLEDGAIAWDAPSQSTRQESIRKRRTIAGCAQLIVNQPRWLLPWRNPIWWEFISHKLLRLVSPLLLVIALSANVALATTPVYRALLIAQIAFYGAALLAWGLSQIGRRLPLLGTVLMFVSLNVTTVLALWDAIRGRFRATWQRSA
ncbi:MAG: glycosyltransferase [Planctomycetaceae bacterium]|nr:glycosyltransferase [Planctomycetaceae bacterium]